MKTHHVLSISAASVLGVACASAPGPATPHAPVARQVPIARETSDASLVGPEVVLHESPFKIRQPPKTRMGHEWKAGVGMDWITFESGPHEGESIYISLSRMRDVRASVEKAARIDWRFQKNVLEFWFEDGAGIVDKQYSFKDEVDCHTTPGCHRDVLVAQQIGTSVVHCRVTDFEANDDWALRTAREVCKTLVPQLMPGSGDSK